MSHVLCGSDLCRLCQVLTSELSYLHEVDLGRFPSFLGALRPLTSIASLAPGWFSEVIFSNFISVFPWSFFFLFLLCQGGQS